MSEELQDQRRGTRGLMMGVGIVALIVCVAAAAWVFVPSYTSRTASVDNARTDVTPQRTEQTQGVSTAAGTPPPPASSPNSSSPGTVGRAQEIQSTSSGSSALNQQKTEAVKQFAASAPQSGPSNFTVSVGAAVSRQVELQDMPRALADALPNFMNDQYVVVDKRFVIVEKSTRRIVAVVPVG